MKSALEIAQSGFDVWAAKPHNKKWFRRIDGTPIPNDLVVCIAQAFSEAGVLASVAPSGAEDTQEEGESRYHLTEPTVTINGRAFGKGWLLISEAEYARLAPSGAEPVAPTGEIARRLNDRADEIDRNCQSFARAHPDAALFREAAAALTSLSAERDRAKMLVDVYSEEQQKQLADWKAEKARATASEAEATSLRRKLEEAERIGKMMANAIYNVHQRGLHVNADDMDSLKECQEAWDVAIAAAPLPEDTHHGR